MLSGRPVVRASELRDVERLLVTIYHQWYIGHVALVEPIACNPALCRPATKMAGAVPQSVGELLCLATGAMLQAAKCGADVRHCRVFWPSRSVVTSHRMFDILVD